jgi:hypothetical protein
MTGDLGTTNVLLGIMAAVDDTADRVRTNVRVKTSRVVGVIRGIRVAIESMLEHREPRTQEHF